MTLCPVCKTDVCLDRIVFDFEGRFIIGETTISLTFLENEIVKYLHKWSPDYVAGPALDWHIYKSLDVDSPNNIKVHISNLRKKLSPEKITIDSVHGCVREETRYWMTW